MMIRLSGDGQTPANRIVLSVCTFSSYPNSFLVPDDEPNPSVGDTLSKKLFDKYAGWTDLQNSDKTSARLIEDLFDYIQTGTVSEQLSLWVNNKKDARQKYNVKKSFFKGALAVAVFVLLALFLVNIPAILRFIAASKGVSL